MSAAPVGRTLGIVLGAAVLLVVALFVITALSEPSRQANPQPTPSAAESGAAGGEVFSPLTQDQEDAIVRLERDLAATTGEERVRKQHEMVNLLIGFGRPDLAAQAQEDLARLEGTADAWTRTGDLYFQWMSLIEDDQGDPSPVAARALAAYDSSLALRPEDHNVRARLAWAAQYDSGQPMRAIEETQAVLAQDSTHIGSLQNYAIFLARIGRVEQAVVQMERIKRNAAGDSVLIRNADAFIQALRRGAQANP